METERRHIEREKDISQGWQAGLSGTQGDAEALSAAARLARDYPTEPPAPPDRFATISPTPRNEAEVTWYAAEIHWDGAKLNTRTHKGLQDFLQGFFRKQPLIGEIASVLIPGALAAFLFPVFGPVVAAGAAAVAVQNGLKLLGISLSSQTIETLLKPFENKQLDGSDVQAILEDTLKNLLPSDKQVNKEVTEVVRVIIPEIRVVALEQLRRSLEASLEKQSGRMAEIASDLSKLVEC